MVFENKCFENISNFLYFRIIRNDQLSSGLESHLPIYQAKHGKQYQHLWILVKKPMEILPTLQVNTGFCQNSMILVVLVIGMIISKVTLRKVVPMKISKNLLDLDLQTPQLVPRQLQLPEWLLVQLSVESLWQVIWNYIFHQLAKRFSCWVEIFSTLTGNFIFYRSNIISNRHSNGIFRNAKV